MDDVYGQIWPKLPTDSEINQAVNDYFDNPNADIRVGTEYFIIKHYSKRLANDGFDPNATSRVLLVANQKLKQFGQEENYLTSPYIYYDNQYKKWAFGPSNSYLLQGTEYYLKTFDSAGSLHDAYISAIKSKSEWEFGFAPPRSSNSNSDSDGYSDNQNTSSTLPTEEDDIPWDVVIGAIIGGAVIAGIRKKLKKKKKSEKKESAHYILQLSKEGFDFTQEKKQNLSIRVWKITEKDKKQIPASIQFQNPEPALHIKPHQGRTPLNCQLELNGQAEKSSFNIIVNATAEGNTFQKLLLIKTGGENKIIIEIEPDNKRSLRPNIERVLSCYTKVVDETGKAIPALTEEIKFEPKSDWLDFSKMVMDNEWKAIDIGASDPDANAAVSHPPKSVTLSWIMQDVPEGENALQKDVEIQLLDCKIDTSVDTHDLSFVASKDKTELIFSVFIEDCDGSEPWNFSAAYKTIDDKPDDPISSISIEKISDIKAQVTLTGPILLPKEGEQWIRKLLVISGQQDKEEPLERHLYVYVSKVGLYIEEGINKERELSFIAKGDYEKDIEFGLYKYDAEKEEVVVDKVGLENLSFELLNKKKEDKNLASVLEVDFDLYGLVTNIPRGRYTLNAPVEIPGYGDVTELVYRAKAPIAAGTENPERFQTDITLKVETLNTGKRYPTWQEAYDDCKYIIDKYVPAGPPQDKLRAILEQRKALLDAEGLTELRKKMWAVAYNLILAEGAEGYKDVDAWASAIVETLEWTQWAGDIAFNVLMAIYFKKFGAIGGLGATGASMLKEMMLEGIIFYGYEQGTFEDFKAQQYQKIVPLLLNVAKGRLVSVDNIALLVKNNRPLAWAIFIAVEFLYNLYQTKSMIEAAKRTLYQIRDEWIIGKLTNHIIKNPVKTGLKVADKNGNVNSDYESAGHPPDVSGYTGRSMKAIQRIANKLGVKIITRPTNAAARRLLKAGHAVAKKMFVKNKTISELDTYLGAKKNNVGKVGSFKPKFNRAKMKKLTPAQRTEVVKRYKQRRREWLNQADNIKKYKDKLYVEDGVVYDKVSKKPFTGDIDIYDIRGPNGQKLTKAQYKRAVEELIKSGATNVEHGAHLMWEWQKGGSAKDMRTNKGIYKKIAKGHRRVVKGEKGKTKQGEPLVEFGPGEGDGLRLKTVFHKGGATD